MAFCITWPRVVLQVSWTCKLKRLSIVVVVVVVVVVVSTAPCQSKRCDNKAVCVATPLGEAMCVCPSEDDCPQTVNTVCGSDNNTYISECIMQVRSCKSGRTIEPIRQGYCGKTLVDLNLIQDPVPIPLYSNHSVKRVSNI